MDAEFEMKETTVSGKKKKLFVRRFLRNDYFKFIMKQATLFKY